MMTWVNIKGTPTLGAYEVRVSKRLKHNSRPVQWTVFKGGTEYSLPFRNFNQAKAFVESETRRDVANALTFE